VGLGVQGDLHAGVYQDLTDVELVGLVEPDESKHGLLAARYGVPVHSDSSALLGEVDVVSICAPDDLHVATTVPFLSSGARVLVEKPLATTMAEVRQILAARPDPDALSVGHILRYDPRVVRARDLVRSGDLGDIWHVDVWRDTSRAVAVLPSKRTSVAWFLGIHDADLVRFVTGLEVESISSIGRSTQSAQADVVYSNVVYRGGVVGSMQNNWTLAAGRPSRAFAGLRVVGSAGSVEIDLAHVDMLVSTAESGVYQDTRNWPGRSRTDMYNLRTEIQDFVQAALQKGPAPVPGEDGLAAVRVVEMIHASLAAGGAVISADGFEQ
jgi:predicted dehydrogenase